LSIFSLDRTDAGRKHFFARNILGIGYYDSWKTTIFVGSQDPKVFKTILFSQIIVW
jgi:hypothetical protein